MKVHFIDTSVLVNILDVPNMNQDRDKVIAEFENLKEDDSNYFLLPLATIIETGNHIAHMSDGRLRFKIAGKMSKILENMANEEIPWAYYEGEIKREDILKYAKVFPEMAKNETGIGDLSIVSAYEKYKADTVGVGYIRIWSLDNHLMCYEETLEEIMRRKRRN